MIIPSETKISVLIKQNPQAIDAIASINKHFRKLQNPILRKVLASRVTIAEAARIGKVKLEDMFEKLRPLGFLPEYRQQDDIIETSELLSVPQQYDAMLDVRPDIESGIDPFTKILEALAKMEVHQTLLLINSFEPVPLIRILEDKKFSIKTAIIGIDEVYTYIKKTNNNWSHKNTAKSDELFFDSIYKQFRDYTVEIDVRHLEMPQPMMTILQHLDTLAEGKVLFVKHKKVPHFLFPELAERNFGHTFKHINGDVELIIFRKDYVTS